ncbi:MAG: metallophosphoesterase family protein [Candidatus Njordarchaeales archaeon]
MARALVISDIHDNSLAFQKLLKATDFDLLILSGDICEFRCSRFVKLLKSIRNPIIIVPGNHDCVPCFRKIAASLENIYLLVNDVVTLNIDGEKIVIAGLGGVYSPKTSDMHRFSVAEVLRLANKICRKEERVDILVTHECAKRCADIIPYTSGKRGGKEILYLLHIVSSPRIHVCGHMHVPWIERKGDTICFNPGMGFLGSAGIIDTKRLECEIITVPPGIDVENEWRIIYGYNYVRNVKRSYYRILEELADEIDRNDKAGI